MQFERERYRFTFDRDAGRCSVLLAGDEEALLTVQAPFLLAPEFAGAPPQLGETQVEVCSAPGMEDGIVHVSAPLSGSLTGRLENAFYLLQNRLVCTASYSVAEDHAVRHWHIAPAGSTLMADRFHAYMGAPQLSTNGREFAPDEVDVNTAGHNFAYAIAGPRMIAQRGTTSLCLGGTTLANDFGLECRARGGAIECLRFNYGGDVPFSCSGGERHTGPRLQLLFAAAQDYDAVHGEFVETLHEDGIVERNRYGPEHAAWLRPWYCTWGDQVILAKTIEAGKDWTGQKKSNAILDEAFVRRAVGEIQKHDLNIGTIVIDAGWQDKRGDWNLRTDKFPNLRGLVDDLHADGYKVHMWWAPLQIEEGAQILERADLVAGPNKHGEMFNNYENAEARERIARIVHRFFSSGPEGWDIDGLKLDWMVEKVYAQPGPPDPEWRGEERCINQIYRMFHRIARQHKPAFAIYGGASENPHLAPYSFARGLEERFDADLSYLAARLPMLQALRPGVRIKNHLCYQQEHAAESVRITKGFGGIPEIGLVLPETITAENMAAVKEALAGVGECVGV